MCATSVTLRNAIKSPVKFLIRVITTCLYVPYTYCCEQPYNVVMAWLRCHLSFSLLRSAITCLRGARSSTGHATHDIIDLAMSEHRYTNPSRRGLYIYGQRVVSPSVPKTFKFCSFLIVHMYIFHCTRAFTMPLYSYVNISYCYS